MHLGMTGVTCHFWVTVTLTSDPVLRIIVSGAYLLYSLSRDSKFGMWMHLGIAECHEPFSGHCDLDL